jgi:putative ABC transport system permease protein
MKIFLYLWIGFRNVFRQTKRTFSLGINFTIIAVLLVLVFSFSRGASHNISLNLSQATAGHLNVAGEYIIEGKSYPGVMGYSKVRDIVQKTFGTGAKSFPRYTLYTATYNKGNSKRITYYGIDPELEKDFSGQLNFIEGSWEDFAANPDSIAISKDIADYLELYDVSELTVSTRTRLGAFNTAVFSIAGVYTTNNYFVENLAIAHFDRLQALDLADKDTATIVVVFFDDLKQIDKKRDTLITALGRGGLDAKKPKSSSDAIAAVTASSPRYKVEKVDKPLVIRLTVATLNEVLGILGNIITAINSIGIFLAAVMLFVTAVAIFINLRMAINDRMREIGTMRTIGVEGKGITLLFVFEGLILSLLFIVIGYFIAFVLITVLRYGITFNPSGAFSLLLTGGKLYFRPRISDLLLIMAAIAFFAAMFSFIPARQAGRIRPADALSKFE